ncbi:MAG: hypothetical protein AAGE52_01945 [Myxococcota bacterium]
MRTRTIRQLVGALAFAGAVAIAVPALAEALVVVEVRTPDGTAANGRVVLRPRGEGAEFSCTTSEGGCRIEHVPGGRYTVTFEPAEGDGPEPSNAVIPPEGTVTLRVATR